MNDDNLRDALRGAMGAAVTPPSMSSSEMVDVARRAERRRRARFAGAGSAAAVALIAAGAVVLPGLGSGEAITPGQGKPSATADSSAPTPIPAEPSEKKQVQKTIDNGVEQQRGVELLGLLESSAPAGYSTAHVTPPSDASMPLRWHQAVRDTAEGKAPEMTYTAIVPLVKDGKVGRMLVEVHKPAADAPTELCALAKSFWGMQGDCTVMTVGGKQVGVVTKPGGDGRFDQRTGFRHADGTVVFVAQAKEYAFTGLPALPSLPFTVEQLAELGTSPKFDIV